MFSLDASFAQLSIAAFIHGMHPENPDKSGLLFFSLLVLGCFRTERASQTERERKGKEAALGKVESSVSPLAS